MQHVFGGRSVLGRARPETVCGEAIVKCGRRRRWFNRRWVSLLAGASLLMLTACKKTAEDYSDAVAASSAVAPPAATDGTMVAMSDSAPNRPSGAPKLENAGPDAHWDFVANVGDNGLYVATSSYQLLGDHRVAVGEKITQTPTGSDPEAYTIWVVEFDCVRHTQKNLAYVRYNAAGQSIGQADIDPSNQHEIGAGEGTVGGAVAGPLCKTLQLE